MNTQTETIKEKLTDNLEFLYAKGMAEQKDADAQFALGCMYAFGNDFVDVDEVEAFKWITLAAKQRDDESQCMLGWMYENAIGTAEDEEAAFKYFKLAAKQKNAEAQHAVGRCYMDKYIYDGENTKDYKAAFKYFALAAEQGIAEAQCKLGLFYYSSVRENIMEGNDFADKDVDAAEKYFTLAAKQGNTDAQGFLSTFRKDLKNINSTLKH